MQNNGPENKSCRWYNNPRGQKTATHPSEGKNEWSTQGYNRKDIVRSFFPPARCEKPADSTASYLNHGKYKRLVLRFARVKNAGVKISCCFCRPTPNDKCRYTSDDITLPEKVQRAKHLILKLLYLESLQGQKVNQL